MALTLEVTSYQKDSLGPNSRMVFGKHGGRIGRAAGNDWMLPDPERVVSSQHAVISYQGGGYYITDVSTNGVFINGAAAPLGKSKTVQLSAGDQLLMGEYEILVTIDATEYTGTPDSPFGDADHAGDNTSPTEKPPLVEPEKPVYPGFGESAAAEIHSADNAGPIPKLPDLDDFLEAPVLEPGAEPDHVASDQQFFRPPEAGSDKIPENWDLTGFDVGAAPSSSGAVAGEEKGSSVMSPQATPAPNEVLVRGPVPGDGMPAAEPLSASVGDSPLAAFLSGAGMEPGAAQGLSQDAILADLGQIMREVVAGMMDVLRARMSFKSEFRMPATTIRPVENNPLKFSVGAEQALETLLLKHDPAYLSANEAIREGFQDIKDHELALMAGMRAAFELLMHRFDPVNLEGVFENRGGKGLVVNKKAKYWDLYTGFYRELAREADDNFQQMFGEAFAKAYEDQIYRLSTARKRR